MSTSLIAGLIAWLPTILVGIWLLICLVGGAIRGFRKSLILFIHYIISIVIGFVLFYILKEKILTMNFSFVFSKVGNIGNIDISGANTAYDLAELFVKDFANDYSALAQNADIQQVVAAMAGALVSFVLGIICIFIIPWLIRIILYIIYLLFYREGKHRRNMELDGIPYSKHSFFGLLIGVARGLIVGTLWVSLLSAMYFMVSGDTKTSSELKINLNETLEKVGYTLPKGLDNFVDIDAYYKAIVNSRKTGIGLLYDNIRFDFDGDGQKDAIDYFAADWMLSSPKITSYRKDEKGNNITVRFNIRKEIGSLMNLLVEVINSDVVSVKEEDGEKVPYVELKKLDDAFEEKVNAYIDGSALLSDILPVALIGAAETIQEGKLNVPAEIKQYFTEENVAKIKEVDFNSDLKKLVSVFVKLAKAAPGETISAILKGGIDKTQIINLLKGLSKDTVEGIFSDLSEITLITRAIGPIGLALGIDYFNSDILSSSGEGASTVSLEISDDYITEENLKKEIKNLGSIITKIMDLNLDYDRLFSDEENPDENGLDDPLRYLLEIADDDNKKQGLHDIVDLLIAEEGDEEGSVLVGKVAVTFIKWYIQNQENNEQFTELLGDEWTEVRQNIVDNYSAKKLNLDLHILINSGVKAVPVIKSLMNMDEEAGIMSLLTAIDAEDVRIALLGDENNQGIYDLNALKDGTTGKSLIDKVLKGLLKSKFGDYINETEIEKEDIDWKNEIGVLCDALSVIQNINDIDKLKTDDMLNTMPTLTDKNIDDLTWYLSKSIILKSTLKKIIIDTLNSDDENLSVLNYKETGDWNDFDVTWEDTLDSDGNIVRGEINKVLKCLVFLTEKDENGKLRFADEDGNLVFNIGTIKKITEDETNIVTNSKALVYIIDNVVREMLNPEDSSSLEILIPEDLQWANEYEIDELGHKTRTKTGELWALINVFKIEAISDGDDISADKLQDPATIAKLSDDDIDTLLASDIIFYNIKNLVDDLIEEQLEVSDVSEAIGDTREAWATELKALRDILNIDKLKEDGEIKIDSLKDFDAIKSFEDHDIDTLTASKIVVKALPTILNDKLGEELGDDKIADVVDDWNAELKAIVKVLNSKNLIDNDDNLVVSLDTLAQMIQRNSDSSLNKESAIAAATSRIFMKSVGNKAKSLTSGEGSSMQIIIPKYLEDTETQPDNWMHWSYTNSGTPDYETGEFYKLVLVLFNAREQVVTGLVKELNIDNLATGIVKSNHNDVGNSAVIYATMSDILDKNENLEIRDEAYKTFDASDVYNDIKLEREEVVLLLDILQDLNITDTNNINISAETVFNKTKDPITGEAFKEKLVLSNIMNRTIVNKIVTNADGLSIPNDLEKDTDAAWYATKAENWDKSELSKLIVAINTIEGENGVVQISGNNITVNNDTTKIMNYLNVKPAGSSEKRVATALKSKLMHLTISDKIIAQEIEIRKDVALKKQNGNTYVEEVEIERLVSFIASSGVKIDKINESTIVNMISNQERRKEIALSNILNITFVKQIVDAGDALIIPWDEKYAVLDGSTWTASELTTGWYPLTDAEEDVMNSEVYKLLTAMNVAGIEVDVNNEFQIDSKDIINNKLSPDNISLCFASDIIGYTLSHEIIDGAGSAITDVEEVNVYNGTGYETRAIFTKKFATSKARYGYEYDFLTNDEAKAFIGAIQAMNLGVDSSSNAASNNGVLERLAEDQTRIGVVAKSGIVNKILSDSIISQDVVSDVYPITDTETKMITFMGDSTHGYKYIQAEEIMGALTTAVILGLTNVEQFQNIDKNKIKSLSNDQIESIEQSAIFSKIFSKLIVETKIYLGKNAVEYYNMTHTPKISVYDEVARSAQTNEFIKAILPSDIAKLVKIMRSLVS